MISDTIETLEILEKKGFTKTSAFQIMIIEELKKIGGELHELNNKE